MEIRAFDGKKIHVYEWTEVENPKGVVQILHDMSEHAGRYEAYARYLNRLGYIVVADDHRGHGKTDNDSLGFCRGDMYEDTLRDEGQIAELYHKRYAGLSYFLLGVSYGAFLAQSFMTRYGELLDGAVLVGGGFKKDRGVRIGAIESGWNCFCGKAKFPARQIEKMIFGDYEKVFSGGQWLSSDQENNRRYGEDPLCGFACSNKFFKDLCKGLRRLYTRKYRAALRRDLPVLVMAGREDPLCGMGEGAKKLVLFYREKIGMKNADLVLFENSRHDLLGEWNDRDRKWEAPAGFFEKISAEFEWSN